ncbi:phosphosugar isomerase [Rhizobium leguminosarum bv. phaseoli CCGM1]|nr:phosphosugar isomerase [Rhizobium leguminosarum bv. phaseoli CCGM1]
MLSRRGPRARTTIASTASAATVPATAGRQPRSVPTARMIVNASTTSTIDAMKAATMAGTAMAQDKLCMLSFPIVVMTTLANNGVVCMTGQGDQMNQASSFAELVASRSPNLSRTEHRVARYFAENLHQILVHTAIELANAIGTSDASIIRTARALGFDGLDGMRRAIADEFSAQLTLPERLSRTILKNAGDLEQALEKTLTAQAEAISTLRSTLDAKSFRAIVHALTDAREIVVFGVGPTSAMAQYFCTQLGRLGLSGRALTSTGLSLADELLPLRAGDVVFIMAYSRVYRELSVLLNHAQALGLQTVLVTDSLEKELAGRVTRVVTVPRGRADDFSLHSATLAFLETLLVGLATLMPEKTVASLDQLNRLRADLAGQAMTLPLTQSVTSDPRHEDTSP